MSIPYLWGTDKKIISNFSSEPGYCPKCEEKAVSAHVYQQYNHLLGIPLYPTNKAYKVRCRHCSTHFYGEAIPDEVRDYIASRKREAGTPVMFFVGSVLYPATLISLILLFF
ncbi:MAG: hypothetical protein H6581_23990 [Bacteroidia bacterium]|nr:hypothetical protein [Bacteroidia bacterium]